MIPFKDNYFWFGVCEDNKDPAQQGRLRIRIHGAHTEDKSLIPTEDLPWCQVAQGADNASISGLGLSPNGALPGTMLAGIFLDGEAKQQPIALFSIPGRRAVNKNSSTGFNDPSGTYPRSDRTSDINPLVGGSDGGATPTNTPFLADRANNAAPPATVDKDVFKEPDAPVDTTKAPWMPFAIGEIGTNEEKNPTRVKEYHKVGGGSAMSESVPWCASFIGWCLDQAAYKGTRSALARSYSNFGQAVDPKNVPYGSVVVMSGTRGPSSGHVVFFTKDLGDKFECVGGNQTVGDGKKFDTGGQVTRGTFSKSKIVAIRFPTQKK